MRKNILVITLFTLFFFSLLQTQEIPTPYIAFRSQGVNAPRHMIGTVDMMYLPNKQKLYGLLSATFEYAKNFNPKHITHALFGADLQCENLIISGSAVTNRSPKDWLADHFLLPQDFQSTVHFKPSIKHYLVDLQWYLGLDQWHKGLYFTLYAPLVHMHQTIHIHENIINHGVTDFAAGVFSPQPFTVGSMNKSFTSYITGNALTSTDDAPLLDINQTLANRLVSIAVQPLQKAVIAKHGRTKTRLADLRAIIGWNHFYKDKGRVGIYGHVAAPTGIRPTGKYLFEPIVGNGHHWEVGGGFNGAYCCWHNYEKDHRIIMQADAAISHLFSARQHRTFDLKNKPFSRYMLAMQFKESISDNLKGSGTIPSAQFNNEISPVANLTNITVHASSFQLDAVLMMSYSTPHWTIDGGYNLWARAAEDVNPRDNDDIPLTLESWGLKGDARIFGFIPLGGGATLPVNTPIALSATQHNATINTGLNGPSNTRNQNIDAPQLATADSNNVALQNITNAPNSAINQINTSINPIFISLNDLETSFGKTRGLSSTIFGNIQYRWHATEYWTPALSLGFKAEFDHHGASKWKGIYTTGASWWALWLKGTVEFE